VKAHAPSQSFKKTQQLEPKIVRLTVDQNESKMRQISDGVEHLASPNRTPRPAGGHPWSSQLAGEEMAPIKISWLILK
jgi:hypothetical protein